MSTGWIVLIIVLVIIVALFVGLYFYGKKLQKRQEEQQAQMEAMKQNYTILVIDKKKLPLKESGLPQSVIEQAPKLMRRSKLPIVKAKIGPQIMNLVADEKIFESIPVKKEIKATISGIYITEIRGLRGALPTVESAKKKGRFARFVDKIQEKGGAKPLK